MIFVYMKWYPFLKRYAEKLQPIDFIVFLCMIMAVESYHKSNSADYTLLSDTRHPPTALFT